jgi:hypothetical protein
MTPAVSSDTAIALVGQKEHLIFKGVRVEAIGVIKNDGLPRSRIFKIEFSAVFDDDSANRVPPVVGVQ